MKILVVDDDPSLLDTTAHALRCEGFNIIVASDGSQALRRWEGDHPDLVLLDIWMPRMNGLEVCRKIRQSSRTPVIMLTGADDEQHIIQGFTGGADDYVTKPFSPRELAMRIRAILRRGGGNSASEPPSVLQVGEYTLNLETHHVRFRDVEAYLTPLEFRILHLLAINEGLVVTFERLMGFTWGYGEGTRASLKQHVSRLRQKLQLDPGRPGYIAIVPGLGYRLGKS
jgi:DNA-binding response OmpR family regulator